jgi:agmatine/peptidylarginine deiminase
MVTNDGVIASSYLVATQNELPLPAHDQTKNPSAEVIEQRMKYILEQLNRFMGVNTYHVLSDPTGTYIGHIDCWGKFLDDHTVLIAEPDNEKIKIGLNHIATQFKEWEFHVFRVKCQDIYLPQVAPPDNATTAAYTNSLILNDHVYVPIVGPPHEDHDRNALAVYQSALPHHTIVGIPAKYDTPWLGTDALHCRTHEVPREVVDNWLRSRAPQ